MARQKVSERAFIDAAGAEVDRMEQATGARYTLVQAGKSFDLQLGAAGAPATMFGVFGFWTKVGNVANTVLNDKDEPGTPQDAASEIEDFLAGVEAGTWREAGEGAIGRGPKYDNDVLAHVLVAALGSAAKGDVAYYAARLADNKGESDPANKGYRSKVIARDDIKAAYWVEMQKRGVVKPAAPAADTLA